MFNWIRHIGLKRQIKKISTESLHEKFLDEELKNTAKEYALTIREAEKMKKLIESKRRVIELNKAVQNSHKAVVGEADELCPHGKTDDEDCTICDSDDDKEPDYDPHDPEQIMLKVLADKIAGRTSPSLPSATAGLVSPARAKLQQMLNGMSDEQASEFMRNLGL